MAAMWSNATWLQTNTQTINTLTEPDEDIYTVLGFLVIQLPDTFHPLMFYPHLDTLQHTLNMQVPVPMNN